MFTAIRNNIGYQNVASLMRHSAEYETTDVIDIKLNGRGASIGASGGSTAELSQLTGHAKNGWYSRG